MMKPIQYIYSVFTAMILFGMIFGVAPALATQKHGAPEGIYVHQFSHVFFIFAMGILIYWLRSRALVRTPGWRSLQYACLFFLLWSLDAFLIHLLDEQLQWVKVWHMDAWHLRLDAPAETGWLSYVYYLLKLDHLFCVPGMVFLFTGLRRLNDRPARELEISPSERGDL